MNVITSAAQLPARDPKATLLRVSVPEWGEDACVFIGRLNGLQFHEYTDFVSKESAYGVPKSRHAALIAACLRDENGKPVSSPGQSEAFACGSDEAVLLRLFFICEWHNKIDTESYEDLKKNYAAILSSGSVTDSPAT